MMQLFATGNSNWDLYRVYWSDKDYSIRCIAKPGSGASDSSWAIGRDNETPEQATINHENYLIRHFGFNSGYTPIESEWLNKWPVCNPQSC